MKFSKIDQRRPTCRIELYITYLSAFSETSFAKTFSSTVRYSFIQLLINTQCPEQQDSSRPHAITELWQDSMCSEVEICPIMFSTLHYFMVQSL